ncbi:MAG TPA: hypothetical protein VF480_01990 [Verrucomicrobiae bacterium]
MKRPIALTSAGLLLFSMGLSGVVADCVRTHGFAIPSVNLFTMIAGVGLLKLWRGARWYSLFIFGSALLFALPMCAWAIFNSDKVVFQFPAVLIDDRPHAIVPLFAVILAMIGYVGFSAWMLWVLMRRDVRELFQHKTNSPTASVSI